MTPSEIRASFATYRLDPMTGETRPVFIGCCPLEAVATLADAWTYAEFANIVTDAHTMRLSVLGVFATRDEAEALQQVTAAVTGPMIGLDGARCERKRISGRNGTPVRNAITGARYDTAGQAAKAIGCTSAAMSRHLSGELPTLKGYRFERIDA